ncbi:hypothetical protein L1987_01184 [Smallanthus sonchifolius]|uniref:Uncharacterized protein n=1 Tax=Smallanthus sonchifolius TaxID=185202 RepID=A0ACB9K4L0_9ASTR|nr:hypothetical protein L1987_01184 [Smallanthus sonchifolius]
MEGHVENEVTDGLNLDASIPIVENIKEGDGFVEVKHKKKKHATIFQAGRPQRPVWKSRTDGTGPSSSDQHASPDPHFSASDLSKAGPSRGRGPGPFIRSEHLSGPKPMLRDADFLPLGSGRLFVEREGRNPNIGEVRDLLHVEPMICARERDPQEGDSDQHMQDGGLEENTMEAEGNSIPFNVQGSDNNSPELAMSDWDNICLKPITVTWPGQWNNSSNLDLENHEWLKFLDAEEATHWKKKKKRKVKGKNPFKASKKGKGYQEDSAMGEEASIGNRRKIKIWSSKNRKPEKNLCLKKVSFNQELVPNKMAVPPLGFSEFQMGHERNKENGSNNRSKESMMNKMDSLFEELVIRKSKLQEIAANINTTEENIMLLNSILGMKKFKLLKFLAKVNEEGVVTIDENMVDSEKSPEGNNTSQNLTPHSSYAQMLTGQGCSAQEDKVQYYPLLLNGDGTHVAVINPKYIVQAKEEYKNVLYGYFIGADPILQFVRFNLFRMWKQYGITDISLMVQGFRGTVPQDQRFDAKKHVLEKLVPLDIILAEWPAPKKEYFRHLCSIYSFDEGYLATIREKDDEMEQLPKESGQ